MSIWRSQSSSGGGVDNSAEVADNTAATQANAASIEQNTTSIDALTQRVDTIDLLLTSNDVSLDELQEIVDFVKANKDELDTLSASGVLTADEVAVLKVRLTDAETKITANEAAIAQLGSPSLVSLSDVNAATAQTGQVLALASSGQWVPATVALEDFDADDGGASPDIPAYITVAEEDPYIPVAEEDPYITVAEEVA